jgi:hypothetical protein
MLDRGAAVTSRSPRTRFWYEAILGGLAAVLAILTSIWPDWIEAVFGVDPDHGNGSLEWAVVAVLAVAAIACAIAARAEWRRPPAT